jgi:hypothetical protein
MELRSDAFDSDSGKKMMNKNAIYNRGSKVIVLHNINKGKYKMR